MRNDGGLNDTVSKALRALLILDSHDSMRVSDLARELQIAVSTAHRLLSIMRSQQFVEQDTGSRRYRLGQAAISLGHPTTGVQDLLAVAHPHLERLCVQVNETVNLVVLDDAEALFVDGVEAPQTLRVVTRTGTRIPAYAFAGGKALLAHLPYSSLFDRFPHRFPSTTEHTLADLAALKRELDEVRQTGYALNLGEHLQEVYAIAVPIQGVDGPRAAITVAVPSTRWHADTPSALEPKLRATAERIEYDLRHGEIRRLSGPSASGRR